MGERRADEFLGAHRAAKPDAEVLRRLVANREWVAAMLRASHRAEQSRTVSTYASSGATRPWGLDEAYERAPDPDGRCWGAFCGHHGSLLEPSDDER